ncbi:RHS repeat-associated core domain-containing protein [Lysinibacillus xylanilyticus]|uniref:RHS repeat-associated core domain-containing protein n=1 Tax=Lysinibacillus xylanilyticus TaxID=582475 RepID=UPI0037F78B7F
MSEEKEGHIVSTYEDIELVWPYPLIHLDKLTIKHKGNDHARLYFTGMIAEEQAQKYIQQVSHTDEVVVKFGRDKDILFSGRIENAELQASQGVHYVSVEAISFTANMDIEKRSRSFQDANMTYVQLINTIVGAYPQGDYIDRASNGQAIGQISIQYLETDWEFIKRMASRLHAVVFPDLKGKGARFWLGTPQSRKSVTIDHLPSVLRMDVDSYRLITENDGTDVSEADYTFCEFESTESYDLGTLVQLKGRSYVIAVREIYLDRGVLKFQYTAQPEKSIRQRLVRNLDLIGAAFTGKIIDVTQNTVKIHLDIDKNQDKEKAHWFAYSADANSVMYLMPQIGARAQLHFPSAVEEEAIVISSVRVNPVTAEGGQKQTKKMADTTVKSLATNVGKDVTLGVGDITFSAVDGVLDLKMDDGDGITFLSNSTIMLAADETLEISGMKELSVKAEEWLAISAQEKSHVILATDTQLISTLIEQEGTEKKSQPPKLNAEAIEATSKVDLIFPQKQEKEKEKKGFFSKLLDGVSVALDVAGFIPVIGTFADIANAGISLARGDYMGAAMNIVGAVPVVGDAAKTAYKAGKAAKAADKAVTAAKAADKAVDASKAVKGMKAAYAKVSKTLDSVSALANKGSKSVKTAADKVLSSMDELLAASKAVDGMKAMAKTGLTKFNHGVLKKFNCTQGLSKKFCKRGFEPVDLITGRMIYEGIDFELPGPIPLSWERAWYSDSSRIGLSGHGMHFTYDLALEIFEKEDLIGIVVTDGRAVGFPILPINLPYFNKRERMTLTNTGEEYHLFEHDTRLIYVFEQTAETKYRLKEVRDEQEHHIQFTYNLKGFLSQVTDSVGRLLEVTTNEAGRMTEVALRHQMSREVLVRYVYNNGQDLIEIQNALGQSTHIKYNNHLMMQKIDRNKNSFFWRYDGPTTGARVIKTWGDGNVLAGELSYHEGYNEITNSLGHKSYYYFNEDNLCTKIVHPDGSEVSYEYNEDFELLQTVDEDDRVTASSYDEWANPVTITLADGSTLSSQYDEKDRLIQVVNAEGGSRQWIYNENGTLQANILEDGTKTEFSYNEQYLIKAVTNAQGHMVSLAYDADLNLSQVTLPDGTSSTWAYDRRGNCTTTTNPLGATEKFRYDSLNRLIRANLSDENDVQLKYNAYDEVVFAKDNHTQVAFDYTILGSLVSREQGGKKVKFTYDTEEQLTAVINERGETYQFERDTKGDIIKEIGFDEMERTYERSLAGLVQRIQRPGDRWTAYQHDGLGNIIRADYYDDTWETFGYDKNGSLIETENEHVAVKLERDPSGQVIKEWQNDHWIASSYDELGNRSQITSSLGAKIDVARNEMGNVSQITASRSEQEQWTASMQYNELGQEIERILPGDVISKWQYDVAGRPTHHRISSQNRDTRRRKYNWDVNHRLRSMVNELTGVKVSYGYDEFSNLVWSNQGGQFDFLHRSVDDVGNLYETKEKTDRVYGAGSRLLETREATFSYDDEGNLIQKVEKNGDTWKYEYNGNGMMSKVIKPDNTEVTFKYDPLGRRIEKCSYEKIVKFVWDGNIILHEYFSQNNSDIFENLVECSSQSKSEIPDNLVTWVFNDGFVPSAKITCEGNYSIISDYLGTPIEAYDEEGKKVWSAELDIYGRVEGFVGEKDFIPFRYQGQYEDEEIGLYYNRFRYYSPTGGIYTQRDPIGLVGGINIYGYVSNPNIFVDLFGLTGTYFFTDGVTSYIGKGPASRMYESMSSRVGGKNNVLKGIHFDFGSDKMGFMVEHLLMEEYDARDAKNFANSEKMSSPGKKKYGNATKKERQLAETYAELMKEYYEETSSGIKKRTVIKGGCK